MKNTVLLLVAAAVGLSFPFWTSTFVFNLGIRILFFSLMVMSVGLFYRQLDRITLMPSVFFGIAAYTVGILQVRFGFSFPIPVLAGLLFALIAAMLVSLIVVRSGGVYFLMLTLVIGLAVWALALQMTSLTGGTTGIIGLDAPVIMGVSLGDSPLALYYMQLVVFAFAVGLYLLTVHSRFGLIVRGIRESESRMKSLGYPTYWLKCVTFTISAFLAALGGVSFVYFYGLINPDPIALSANVDALLAAILGGIGSLPGLLLGSGILKILDTVLSAYTSRYQLISGIVFVIVILFLPDGIFGLITNREEGRSIRDLFRRYNSGLSRVDY